MWQRGLSASATAWCLALAVCASASLARADDSNQTPQDKTETLRPSYVNERLQGKVDWLADALQRRFGIATDADARHVAVAIETQDGHIVPIVKDARGRAFHLDPRLRNVPLELLVRRYEGAPVVQVIRVYRLRDGRKYELDYWCDICAIAMYELKPCECCQGEIRLRERPVVNGETLPEEAAASPDETAPPQRSGDPSE